MRRGRLTARECTSIIPLVSITYIGKRLLSSSLQTRVVTPQSDRRSLFLSEGSSIVVSMVVSDVLEGQPSGADDAMLGDFPATDRRAS
jgi:hypothetical protein